MIGLFFRNVGYRWAEWRQRDRAEVLRVTWVALRQLSQRKGEQ